MYIVTNRNLQPKEAPEKRFGENFNQLGPNELRLAKANKVNGAWQVEVLPDRLSYGGQEMLASEVVFLQTQDQMRTNKTNGIFFVHGFNTDFLGPWKVAIACSNFITWKCWYLVGPPMAAVD